ncbi:MAG: type II toxin-antitoxin system VapC family toxin, partial [Bacteroidota bacterium]
QEFNILPIFPSLDIYAAEKARLRKAGEIVDDLDLFIGATAIYHEMIMVTNNEKHLGRMELIQIENWVK